MGNYSVENRSCKYWITAMWRYNKRVSYCDSEISWNTWTCSLVCILHSSPAFFENFKRKAMLAMEKTEQASGVISEISAELRFVESRASSRWMTQWSCDARIASSFKPTGRPRKSPRVDTKRLAVDLEPRSNQTTRSVFRYVSKNVPLEA